MANEELIYRITRAVYDRLGTSTDESMVEQLVTDIYKTIEPASRETVRNLQHRPRHRYYRCQRPPDLRALRPA
jgi:hypothetical protein